MNVNWKLDAITSSIEHINLFMFLVVPKLHREVFVQVADKIFQRLIDIFLMGYGVNEMHILLRLVVQKIDEDLRFSKEEAVDERCHKVRVNACFMID